MTKDNKTALQNPIHGGLDYLHDESWLKDHAPKRPKEVESSGLQVKRHAKIAGYDIEKRRAAIQRDDEDDPMIGILDPVEWVYRVHEFNTLPNRVIPPDGEYAGRNWDMPLQPVEESKDVDADGKKEQTEDEEPPGRVRPWSKCWHQVGVIDAKHLVGSRFNRSTWWTRHVDYRHGALHQLFDIRETLVPEGIWSLSDIDASSAETRRGAGATHTGDLTEDTELTGAGTGAILELPPMYQTAATGDPFNPESWPLDRAHLRLNRGFSREGGYITIGDPLNVGFHVDGALNVTPSLFAQLGDAFVITPDDVYTYTQRDIEGRSLLNLWHDVHFHMSPDKDGRIYFTRTPAGIENFGIAYKGEMVGDPVVANTMSQFGQESVNWRPQLKRPVFYVVPVAPLNPTPEGGGYWPPGWDFPPTGIIGVKTGYVFDVGGEHTMTWQGFANPVTEVIQEIVPIQIGATLGTDIPLGTSLSEPYDQIVFRYEAFIISRNDDLVNPKYVDLGGFIVHEITQTGPRSMLYMSSDFDDRQIAPGDMISVTIWRDYDNPLDNYAGDAYIFDVAALVGITTLAGECFNMKAEDGTVATDPVIVP